MLEYLRTARRRLGLKQCEPIGKALGFLLLILKCQSQILNLATALVHTDVFLLMSEDWRKEMIGCYLSYPQFGCGLKNTMARSGDVGLQEGLQGSVL